MNNSFPLPSERFPPVPSCSPTLHPTVMFWFWRPPHLSDNLLTSSLNSHCVTWTGDIRDPTCTESPRPSNLWFFRVCITNEAGVCSCTAEAARSQRTSTAQPEPFLSRNGEQDRATQQSNCLLFTGNVLHIRRHFINFMRFVVRKHGNKRTIQRPFNHWLFTFINTPVLPIISTSPVQSPGNLKLY